MTDLVLHHYAMSPFSQKMRSMLGYAGLEWSSVNCAEMPPRPHLEILAGGYRKMPVGQVGADVFCDTRTIATEIAGLCGKPDLALENCSVEAQAFAAKTDLEVFFACLFTSGTWSLAKKVWTSMSAVDIARFFGDRFSMGRKASVPSITPKQAKLILHENLADMESRLQQQDFLFGAMPNHADFSAFHSLWFSVDIAESKHIDNYPAVQAWFATMRDFGEGGRRELAADDALAMAREAEPRKLKKTEKTDINLGNQVVIGPVDYGKEQSQGTLVGSDDKRWVIARTSAEIGLVHVHFPKQGYQLNLV